MQPTKPFHEAAESTQLWWSHPGILYFLGVGEPTAAVKIGMVAVKPEMDRQTAMSGRLKSIQSSNHELVKILGIIIREDGPHPTKDTEDHERELHNEFQYLARFKQHSRGGEWFDAAPELLDLIRSIAVLPADVGIPDQIGIRVSKPDSNDA